VMARADLRSEQPIPPIAAGPARRAEVARALVGVDGRLRWGERGFVELAGSHQQATRTGVGHLGQGRLRLRTPAGGPVHLRAHGLVEAGRLGGERDGGPTTWARREAGFELGVEHGRLALSGGPLLWNHAVGEDALTEVGWAGRGRLDLAGGLYVAAETRRGRDLLAGSRTRSFSTGLFRSTALTHGVAVGPGFRGARGFVRSRAVGRFESPEPGDEAVGAGPAWRFEADGAVGVWRGLSVAGAVFVRPSLIVHLSARYDADPLTLEIHGRGRTERFEAGDEPAAGGFALGFASRVDLGAGFALALAVENVTDARLPDPERAPLRPGALRPGIDGRLGLSWTLD